MNTTPDEWLSDFLVQHRERFQPHDWPDISTDEYVSMIEDWITAFRSLSVSEDEARRASRRLVLNPPKWRREHLPAVVETVKTMRAERAPAETPNTREAAAAASRGCWQCDGGGLAPVVGRMEVRGEVRDYTISGHCSCALGRWMRQALSASRESEYLLRRIPDLAHLAWGFRPLREAEQLDVPTYAESPR